jgi:hypothetical protein
MVMKSRHDYFSRFIELLKVNYEKTNEEIWNLLEDEWLKNHSRKRHETYGAFRNAKSRYYQEYRD